MFHSSFERSISLTIIFAVKTYLTDIIPSSSAVQGSQFMIEISETVVQVESAIWNDAQTPANLSSCCRAAFQLHLAAKPTGEAMVVYDIV